VPSDASDWSSRWDARPGYLNTASYGLPPRYAWERLQQSLAEWRGGETSWEHWADTVETARRLFADLVRADVDDVIACATVSEVAGLVASSLPDGAHVLVPRQEFTSIVFPWAVHKDRKVRVTEVPLDELAGHIDDSTTLVAFSAVQSHDGAVADLAAITAAAREHGAIVVVDATQALGWRDVPLDGVDVLVTAAYKWLMAPRGTTLAVVSARLAARLRPHAAGWFAGADVHESYYGLPLRLAPTARRFDQSPAWHCWVGTAASLEVVAELGVEAIHQHDVALCNRVREAFDLPPEDTAIVALQVPDAERRLADAGIRAAVRAGALRLSFHAYNTDDDVDRVLKALR
jgi:selenocysteine lyase/cysteine desulfurase